MFKYFQSLPSRGGHSARKWRRERALFRSVVSSAAGEMGGRSFSRVFLHRPHSPTHVQAAHPTTRFGRAGKQQGVACASHARGFRQVDARPQRRLRRKSTPGGAHQGQQQAGIGGKAGEDVERQKTRKRREAGTRACPHNAVGLHDRRSEGGRWSGAVNREAKKTEKRPPSPPHGKGTLPCFFL